MKSNKFNIHPELEAADEELMDIDANYFINNPDKEYYVRETTTYEQDECASKGMSRPISTIVYQITLGVRMRGWVLRNESLKDALKEQLPLFRKTAKQFVKANPSAKKKKECKGFGKSI